MIVRYFRRSVLNISGSVLMLAGCGSQPPMPVPNAMPKPLALSAHDVHHKSWMRPEAVRRDLLYVAQSGVGVEVYTYPSGHLVGSLGAFGGPSLCVDTTGNIFVPGGPIATQVSIYAHGAAQPFLILNDPYSATGCAVDPSSERLAVTTFYQNTIVVFPFSLKHGWHFAKTFSDIAMEYIAFCVYDTYGNLFVDGKDSSGNFSLAELPKGSDTFTAITLNKRIALPGSMQWDGKYLAIDDGESSGSPGIIYRFALAGNSGKSVGTTILKPSFAPGQFWIQGATIIGPMSNLSARSIGFWPFPKGGSAVKSFSVADASGEVVSLK
jgi:hypothetical protein